MSKHQSEQLRLAWIPQIDYQASGYGFVSKRYRRALRDAGVHITTRRESDWHARIFVGVPRMSDLGRVDKVEDAVIHTMCETDTLPKWYVDTLNRYALVWTPSQWVSDTFARCGVSTPIMTAGYGVDREFFHPEPGRDFANLGRPLRFGIWAHSMTGRKFGWKALRAYLEASPADATLDIKLTSKNEIRAVKVDGSKREDIAIYRGAWPIGKLTEWVRSIDVMIYLSGGEGFGLQPLEAMASGCVVIAVANTGMTEYLSPENHIQVTGQKRVRQETLSYVYGHDATVVEPEFESTVAAIRWASANRPLLDGYRQAALNTAEHWSWERAATLAHDSLSARFINQPIHS